MSSTTAVLPVGPMSNWCMTSFDSAPHDPFWDLCANTTRGHESDFATICCDGEIINTEVDIFYGSTVESRKKMLLEDMVCCRQAGMNPGGILPLPQDYTHCASGDPTPLASMAATNTDNAQNFAVTYESASGGTADWTTRSSPSCLWVNTKNASSTTEVTLPAAVITTLPAESGDVYYSSGVGGGYNATARSTSSTASTPTAGSGSGSSSAESASSTGENGATRVGSVSWSQALLLIGLPAAYALLQNVC